MIARLLPAALALFAVPAAAQECDVTGGPENCVRVLACIGDDGLWFEGRAVGWNEGTIAGSLSDGGICTGRWAYTSEIAAETRVSCDTGLEAAVVAISRDPATGTTVAEGRTADGRRVTAWSGKYVADFLRGPNGTPTLPCTTAPIPLG